MKNQKGFVQIILVLLVVALIGGAYYFGKVSNKSEVVVETPTKEPVAQETQKPNTPTVKPTADPTANWKTYTETREIKFTIRYPSNWIIDTKDAMYGGKKAWFDGDKEAIGSVGIIWNTQPVEPNCNSGTERKEMVQLKNRTIEMCHSLGSTQEPEGYFYNGSFNGVDYSIVTSNYVGEDKRKIILKVLSTLEI